eukprot:CAMPEP_0113385428 /NCGR_PEP_ID=MMETSP0013_2-20120614/7461_1 /TAXON_ID=2843 ORGANISM="Skeletonema costatum, Strain 1716" /NCGR_SAMPLE_ID=MMETSP0013_2 /ASSEMBLY_ACC=CAM_ASM_000158 /LENGTH=305 /DNA_ID=CAMNT_0000268183 /DNA_START=65 /DNA_END=982 /DNA_ORIENTATION=- /assembly_acc=CAM_ASM_000158
MAMVAKEDDDIAATAQMCTHCFDVLLQKLHPSTTKESNADDGITSTSSQYTPPNVKYPLFVTWEKCQSPRPPPLLSKVSSSSGITTPASSSIITDDETSTHNNNDTNNTTNTTPAPIYELRGCIGTLAPRHLQHALSEFAITSALHDQRFDPISLHELPLLRVGVSLLVKYEECQDCLDWIVGVHGIIIKFSSSKGMRGMEQQYYSATFLPEVAKEQCWNQKETILSLIRKAGYRGNITNGLLSQIQCTRYQSSKCRIAYHEYIAESHCGKDPLSNNVELIAAVVAEEVGRKQRGVNHVKPCVNL